MRLPPLLTWFTRQFEESPVSATLIAILALVVILVLARVAMKLLLVLLILLALAIGASYLFVGEERTEQALRQGAQEALERGEEPQEAPR